MNYDFGSPHGMRPRPEGPRIFVQTPKPMRFTKSLAAQGVPSRVGSVNGVMTGLRPPSVVSNPTLVLKADGPMRAVVAGSFRDVHGGRSRPWMITRDKDVAPFRRPKDPQLRAKIARQIRGEGRNKPKHQGGHVHAHGFVRDAKKAIEELERAMRAYARPESGSKEKNYRYWVTSDLAGWPRSDRPTNPKVRREIAEDISQQRFKRDQAKKKYEQLASEVRRPRGRTAFERHPKGSSRRP